MKYEFSPESKILRLTPECGEEVFKLGKLSAFVKPAIVKYSDDILTKINVERVAFDIEGLIREIISEN